MNLAALISSENGVAKDAILLLRHGNDSVAALRKCGATVEEYTALQPIESKYDYWHPKRPRISFVCVIVDDKVYGVFKVTGVQAEGSSKDLASAEYLAFDSGKSKRLCRRFALHEVPSLAVGQRVSGWERGRTRTPVQRLGNEFFGEVSIGSPGGALLRDQVDREFMARVEAAKREPSIERQRRLREAPEVPAKVLVPTYVFNRNPDVVAEVLERACGVCEKCKKRAPFERSKDGSPYLEVHHKVLLAEGGKDTVGNAIAVCPNCHREAHYG
ncbi:HNH endonuclease [Paucibacter sp. DJ1R-11]|uniref:HNH endonuclease n=1 Tax=Paucibacter sp. DJ1R-11 TaxID=2893556 RepID=UPI0021E4C0D3|nr:HNH endonuclease signature motif containing protein [Paucibacter sp. DJ1R-11]MCV2366439.1 HNH endonuclease [Paucibacter sp. DJ1R-11]